jgi:NAD(P)-dependent dehydrogenase (short-subunit alcohol dehydrogenase family)
MSKTILITGASSGFGAMAARGLANAGHHVFAAMRDLDAHDGKPAADMERIARDTGVKLVPITLDVTSQDSADAAVARVLDEAGRLDVVVHNAGHMTFGPAEAFTAEQVARVYDVNVVGTQRVNRAALPHLRQAGQALLLWIGSTSTRGGTPPFLGPYFAAKAGMDTLAQSYALELARFGIETTILVPGAFTKGTMHFEHATQPEDEDRADAYWSGRYAGIDKQVLDGLTALEPHDADPEAVGRAIVEIVAMPHGQRPFRLHIDPSQDGAEIVNGIADRVRAQLIERIGLSDLLRPSHRPD